MGNRMLFMCLLICSLGIRAQHEATVIEGKCLVQFNGSFFDEYCHLEIPEGDDVQRYASKIIFGEENCGLKEAYETFTKLVEVKKPVHPLLDKEAIRVLANMPRWLPGQQGGFNVRVRYTFPVTFRLH